MTNLVNNAKFWTDFNGVTQASFDVLNTRLEAMGQKTLHTLADLKKEAEDGLFDRKKSKNSRQTILGMDVVRQFLSLSNIKNTSILNFTSVPSIARICEEAVRRTAAIIQGGEIPKKNKAAPLSETQREGPVFSTACGESFDPGKCSVNAANHYSQQKVSEYMEVFQLHKPRGANYNQMCDILKAHWMRYMTDSLVDVFSQSPLELSKTALRAMASERGIRIEGKTNQEIANDLIRFMVEKVLTLDALDYGMGDAADQIVNLLMSDSLEFSSLTKKQKLGVIMMGSRFNRKLLQYVMVDEESSSLNYELEAFQKGLSALRASVSNLSEESGVKIASGLAHSIAQTEKKSNETKKKVTAEEVEVPLPTKQRVGDDNVHFVTNLKFPSNDSTYKLIGKIFEITGHLTNIAKLHKKAHIFLPSDVILSKVLMGPFKGMSIEEFSTQPLTQGLLDFWTIIQVGNLFPNTKIKRKTFTTRDNISITFELSDDGQMFNLTSGTTHLRISSTPKIHGDVAFYATYGFMSRKFGVQDKGKPVSPVKKSPKSVEVNLPSVSPAKKNVELSACEEFIGMINKKSLKKLETLLVELYGLDNFSKDRIEELSDISELSDIFGQSKILNASLSISAVHFIHEVAVAFITQRDVNRLFDVQLDLSKPAKACKALNDMLAGHIKASSVAKRTPPPAEEPKSPRKSPPKSPRKSPPKSPRKSPPKSPRKSDDESVEFESEAEPETLLEALELLNCTIFLELIQADPTSKYFEDLENNDAMDLIVFAPSNETMETLFMMFDTDKKTITSSEGQDDREQLLASLFSEGSEDDVTYIMLDGSKRTPSSNAFDRVDFGIDCSVFRITSLDGKQNSEQEEEINTPPQEEEDEFVPQEEEDEVSTPPQEEASEEAAIPSPTKEESDIEYEEDDWSESLPTDNCERIYEMYRHLSSERIPQNITEFVSIFPNDMSDDDNDIKAMYVIQLTDLYPGSNVHFIEKAITREMIQFIRVVLLGYKQDAELAGKLSFNCNSINRLYIAGKALMVANVNSKFGATPLPKAATPPASPKLTSPPKPTNPILLRITQDPNLSETLFWIEITGFNAKFEEGDVRSFFAPTNDAWDKFYSRYGTRDTMLNSEKNMKNMNFLMFYHSSNFKYDPDVDADVVTRVSIKGNPKIVPLFNLRFGTGQLENFSDAYDNSIGLHIIDTVQLSSIVDKLKTEESKITDPKSGKFGGGKSIHTQNETFVKDASTLKSATQSVPVAKKQTNELHSVLLNHGSHIMAHFVSKVIVANGKTLSEMNDEIFTLFAPNDGAFSHVTNLSVEETIKVYISNDPEFFASLLKHHLVFHRALTEDDLTKIANEKETLVMSDEGDEDIDIGASHGTLYMRGDKKVVSLAKVDKCIVYDLDVVLTEVPKEDEYEIAEMSDSE
jgi:uncharacterized surface protein with fasciclin (FAS1) repeats